MKWGGVFFVKSGPFLNAGCIMYNISIFYFTFYLFWGVRSAYAPNSPPPAYRPVVGSTGLTPWRVLKLAHQEAAPTRGRSLMYTIAMLSLRDVGQADNKIAGIARR